MLFLVGNSEIMASSDAAFLKVWGDEQTLKFNQELIVCITCQLAPTAKTTRDKQQLPSDFQSRLESFSTVSWPPQCLLSRRLRLSLVTYFVTESVLFRSLPYRFIGRKGFKSSRVNVYISWFNSFVVVILLSGSRHPSAYITRSA